MCALPESQNSSVQTCASQVLPFERCDMIREINRRLEANVFTWRELTRQQQRAVGHVSSLMMDAIRTLDEQALAPRRGDELLPPPRRSQLAFVDGDRGMGKSSVLLTVSAWAMGRSPEATLAQEREEDRRAPPDSLSKLSEQSKRFCWLETLDMEHVSRGSNLFAAILVRIEQLVGSVEERKLPFHGAMGETDVYDQFIADLTALQTDVVLAWDEVSSKRGDDQDPNAYAAEVLRSEHAGLGLNSRLAKVLDGLAKVVAAGTQYRDPLFVLPIDDFDLAPTRCLDLLKLIRLVTTPRLFFLIAGSSRMAEVALICEQEGRYCELLPRAPHRNYEWERLVRPAGVEVAANNLRKLLPPSQRAFLPAMTLDDAMNLKLAGERTLRDSLAALLFNVNSNPPLGQETSLEQYLLLDGSWPKTSSRAAEYLGGTPRQVHDTAMMLDGYAGSQEQYGEDFLAALSEAIERDVSEDWQLLPSVRVELAEAVRQSFDSTIPLRQGVTMDLRFVDSDFVVESPFPPDSASFSPEQQLNWNVKFRRANFATVDCRTRPEDSDQTRSEKERPNQAWIKVPPRLSAGLLLLHDVATSLWGGNIELGPLVPEPAQPLSTYRREERRTPGAWIWTSVPLESEHELRLPWPTPWWTTFRQVECFDCLWASISRSCATNELGLAWMEAILRTVFNEPFKRDTKSVNENKVHELLEKLVGELGSPERKKPELRFMRQMLRETTLAAIASVMVPEYNAFHPEQLDEFISTGTISLALAERPILRRVRRHRAAVWNEVNRIDARPGSRAFLVMAAVAPKFVDQKLNACFDKLGKDHAAILADLQAMPFDKHPVNDVWNMSPTLEELQDRDLREER